MSSGLQATKRRMNSIASTRKITKAMELVATAKLKTWKDLMLENLDYTSAVKSLMDDVFKHSDNISSPYLNAVDSSRCLYILISSSLGLCGGYNYNIFRYADQLIKKDDTLMIFGMKGYHHYQNSQVTLIDDYLNKEDILSERFINNLSTRIMDEFLTGKYQKISLIYTHYVNSLSFVPEELIIFPLAVQNNQQKVCHDIIMEPNPQAIIDSLIPFYLHTILYGKILEATVSEHASRRTAMENASDNADEIYEQLQLDYNKERQALITQEITEVVGGSTNK